MIACFAPFTQPPSFSCPFRLFPLPNSDMGDLRCPCIASWVDAYLWRGPTTRGRPVLKGSCSHTFCGVLQSFCGVLESYCRDFLPLPERGARPPSWTQDRPNCATLVCRSTLIILQITTISSSTDVEIDLCFTCEKTCQISRPICQDFTPTSIPHIFHQSLHMC